MRKMKSENHKLLEEYFTQFFCYPNTIYFYNDISVHLQYLKIAYQILLLIILKDKRVCR